MEAGGSNATDALLGELNGGGDEAPVIAGIDLRDEEILIACASPEAGSDAACLPLGRSVTDTGFATPDRGDSRPVLDGADANLILEQPGSSSIDVGRGAATAATR